MGKILDEKKADLAGLKKALSSSTDEGRKIKFQAGIDKLEKEIESLERDVEKSKAKKETKKESVKKETKHIKVSDFLDLLSNGIQSQIDEAEKYYNSLGTGDKKTLIWDCMQTFNEHIGANEKEFDLEEMKEYIEDFFKEKKEETHNPKTKGRIDALRVGEHSILEDETEVKRTTEDIWIILYKGDSKDAVSLEKKGDDYVADCCEKQGIKFTNLDKAVESIIQTKECHYELLKRQEEAKKRKESQAKAEKKSESTKIAESVEKVANATESKVEKLEKDGKGISKESASDITKNIKSIISTIVDGFKDKSDRKSFLEKLKSEIESELKSL